MHFSIEQFAIDSVLCRCVQMNTKWVKLSDNARGVFPNQGGRLCPRDAVEVDVPIRLHVFFFWEGVLGNLCETTQVDGHVMASNGQLVTQIDRTLHLACAADGLRVELLPVLATSAVIVQTRAVQFTVDPHDLGLTLEVTGSADCCDNRTY